MLGDLLQAALDGAYLKVVYDSIRSGASERMIFPFGLYASAEYWYCACFDHKRSVIVSMRAGHRSLPAAINPPGPQRVSVKVIVVIEIIGY